MNLKTLALIPLTALAGLAFVSSSTPEATTQPTTLAPNTYAIDNAHSAVLFRVEHLGVGQAWGRFNQMEGKLVYDEADATASSIEISIQADSVDSNDEGRDAHLKNADFLSAKEFPTIEFKSSKVEKKGDGLTVTGELELHGKKKEVTANVTHVARNEKDPWGFDRVGFEARFTIDRTDFGMTYMSDGGIGHDVHMIVSLEGTRKN